MGGPPTVAVTRMLPGVELLRAMLITDFGGASPDTRRALASCASSFAILGARTIFGFGSLGV